MLNNAVINTHTHTHTHTLGEEWKKKLKDEPPSYTVDVDFNRRLDTATLKSDEWNTAELRENKKK